MDTKQLQDKLGELEKLISEKEHELQLLKEDLEAVRVALEAILEQEPPMEESAEQVGSEPMAEPEITEDPVSEQEPIEPSAEEPDEEKQHEAIIRTIEEFSRKASRPVYDGPIGDRKTVGETVGSSRLNDLKKAIGINERFLFANELFGGDMGAFTKAVEELNHVESLNDATRLMEENLAIRYHWDEESETVESFKSLVSRRFP